MTLDEFDYTFFFPGVLRQLTPVAATYESGSYSGSGTGIVEGPVIPVDINLTPPRDQQVAVKRAISPDSISVGPTTSH